MHTRCAILLGLAITFTFTACAGDEESGETAQTAELQPCPGDNAGLTLPAGFCATLFAEDVGRPRHIVVAPNGDVYAALQGRQPSPEERAAGETRDPQIAAAVGLRETNGDGRADVIVRIGPGTRGNTGIALHGGYLYVDQGAGIVRYRMRAGQLAPESTAETVITGIPLEPGHRARNFVIRDDGALFLNVGSATNSCQVEDRQAASPGHDPCTELESRAGVWRFDANRTDQAFWPTARYAAGLRNPIALTLHPAGGLYAVVHGRDQLTANWPELFPDPRYQAENPGEELVSIEEGDRFSWPYCYYSMDQRRLVTAPEYGGDGTRAERCADLKPPLHAFPAHWAPMSLLFYTGSQFPARYRDGAFVAFHGSWNRAPLPQQGYNVVFQPMRGGRPSGDFEVFADGFAGLPPDQVQPGEAAHRPVGLAQGPDGALYISDDVGGRIYRITYTGGN